MIVELTKNSNDEVRELSAMNFLGRDHVVSFRRTVVRKYDMNFDHLLFFQPIFSTGLLLCKLFRWSKLPCTGVVSYAGAMERT